LTFRGALHYALPIAHGYDEMKCRGLYHLNAYTVPFKFTGKIGTVTIELKEVKTVDHDEAEKAHKEATLKKALSD
jgi:hypothetical protein